MFQEQDIGRIAETVVGTTENIKDANEEIREVFFLFLDLHWRFCINCAGLLGSLCVCSVRIIWDGSI